MPTVKRRFENDGALTENVAAFVNDTLRGFGLPEEKAQNSANLICTLAGLMAARSPSYIGVAVRRSGERIVLRAVSDGEAYDPLGELDLRALMDSDPPLPEEDFDAPLPRERLLKALRNNLHYYRRGSRNEAEFTVLSNRPQTLRLVTIAFAAAVAVGLLLRFCGGEALVSAASAYVLTPLRTMFLNALKLLVVPVVFFGISSSVAGVSDIREYGRIGGKVLLFYTFTSFAAIVVGYLIYQVLRPGAGAALDLSQYSYSSDGTAEISLIDSIVNIVPSSFAGALAGTDMLQVIFLAALTGVAAALLDNGGDRQRVGDFLGLCSRLFLKIASIVMKAIPVAAFCAMALLVLTIDGAMILALLKLVAGMLIGVAAMFLFYALLFALFVRKSPLRFFRKLAPNLVLFATFCSTSAVMPQSLDTCTRRLGISPKISSFSMPLGSTINMDGACVYLTISTLFLAAVYDVPVTPDMLLKLAVTIVILSMGAPPISGAGFICLSILALQIGVPIEGLGILMGIDQLMSMCRTLINGTGDFVGTAVVADSEGLMDHAVFESA